MQLKADIKTIEKEYEEKCCEKWTLFATHHSPYLEWLSKESCGLSDYLSEHAGQLTHYSFVATNLFIDIIDNTQPEIELLY